jgi:hypothetical protein
VQLLQLRPDSCRLPVPVGAGRRDSISIEVVGDSTEARTLDAFPCNPLGERRSTRNRRRLRLSTLRPDARLFGWVRTSAIGGKDLPEEPSRGAGRVAARRLQGDDHPIVRDGELEELSQYGELARNALEVGDEQTLTLPLVQEFDRLRDPAPRECLALVARIEAPRQRPAAATRLGANHTALTFEVGLLLADQQARVPDDVRLVHAEDNTLSQSRAVPAGDVLTGISLSSICAIVDRGWRDWTKKNPARRKEPPSRDRWICLLACPAYFR